MNETEIKALIRQELPNILRDDSQFRYVVQDLLRDSFADKQQTQDRFEQMLARIDRRYEESERRWAEQKAKEEADRVESERRWAEQKAENEAQRAEFRAEMKATREEVQKTNRRLDSSIGALGARWGLHSEASFRNGLRAILEQSFEVKVLNVTERDEKGVVFGHPDQIELDIIIKNGLLIICELKSSISKSDMHTFNRKVLFYEKKHNRTATRKMVISPMVDERALLVAKQLGIEVHSYAEDVSVDS